MEVDNSQPKSSPFHFDIYACPECENMITTAAHPLVPPDMCCPECGKVKVSEYELRKAKGRTR